MSFRRQNSSSSSTNNSYSASPLSSSSPTSAASLRRARSTHSFQTAGSSSSTATPTNALGGCGSRGGWYKEDDEEEGFGERRPRSNSLSSPGSAAARAGTDDTALLAKSLSNQSLLLLSSTTSGLARMSVTGGTGAASSLARSAFSSSRRWSTLLRSSEHLWQEKDMGLQVSPQDTDRSYRMIRLPNNLRAIVVSDPTTEKAAAALSVRVGASHDPRESPGLAHFLEHMLFLGTEKYPRENTYKDLVNKNGGSSNASTSMDLTLYKFEASSEAYPSVLDVFSQFFISPLFTESATEREMKAVDAENSKNLTSDGRRLLQIMKAVADPNHNWSKFSTGNLATLRDHLPPGFNIRTALLDLYKEHYYAGNMALAMVGPAPLDTLEGLVLEKFGAIKDLDPSTNEQLPPPPAFASEGSSSTHNGGGGFNNPFPPRFMPAAATPHGALGNGGVGKGHVRADSSEAAVPIIRVVPLRDKRELQLTWPMPPVRPLYRAPPTRLLSHLLGHEGEGSVFAVLHRLGWASGVHAGLGTSQNDFCLFEVTVSLTELGQAYWQDVASLVFHYIQLIAEAPVEDLAAMWDETRVIASTSFRFQQKSSEYNYATDLARRLQHYEDRHVLSGGHLYDELDTPALQTFLGGLTEEKVLLFLSFKDNNQQPALLNQTEPWYGHKFGLELVPAQQVRQWACAHVDNLHLPRPNPFIAEEFDILAPRFEPPSATPSPPEQALVTPVLEVWHKLDLSYKQPRAYIILDFLTPLVQRDPATAELLVRYVEHALAESTYDALVAGLGWSISTSSQGLSLRFTGFSHKIQTLLHKVLESLLALDLHESLFRLSKEKAMDAYKNIKMARPDEHGAIFLSLLLTEGRWAWRDKLRRVEGLEVADLAQYHHELLNTASVKVGVFGNVSRESALGVGEQVERLLRRNPKFAALTPSLQPSTRMAMLDKGVEYRLRAQVPNDDDVNSAVNTYFQVGLVDPRQCSHLMLLAQILKEPCFTQLRTKEQLGYIVASGMHLTWFKTMVAGLSFRVLSKTHGPEEIVGRVEAFLQQFREEVLATLAPEEFTRHKASLITNLLEPPKKLTGEASMHWGEIVNGTQEWQRNKLYADAVEATQLEDVQALYDRVCMHPDSRRKLSVLMHGKHHPMSDVGGGGGRVVYLTERDWLAFRASRPLFPCSPATLSSNL